jgi:hypothetical protein
MSEQADTEVLAALNSDMVQYPIQWVLLADGFVSYNKGSAFLRLKDASERLESAEGSRDA